MLFNFIKKSFLVFLKHKSSIKNDIKADIVNDKLIPTKAYVLESSSINIVKMVIDAPLIISNSFNKFSIIKYLVLIILKAINGKAQTVYDNTMEDSAYILP